jgi:hypothetical protein
MATKRWSELSARQRRGVMLSGVVQVTLLIAALVDIWRRPEEEIIEDTQASLYGLLWLMVGAMSTTKSMTMRRIVAAWWTALWNCGARCLALREPARGREDVSLDRQK